MLFNEIDWADSNIQEINIKYDELIINVFNDTLEKNVNIVCKNFAGMTNLCLWDDTYITKAWVEKATSNSLFFNQIMQAYRDKNGNLDNSNVERTLNSGLLKLNIELTNGISCEVYCQNIEVE